MMLVTCLVLSLPPSSPGYDGKTFDWTSYLEETNSKAAPARLFNMVKRPWVWAGLALLAETMGWEPGAQGLVCLVPRC